MCIRDRRVLKPYSKWGLHAHGAALGCVGHILSSEFKKIYIASTFHQDALFPWASHPDTDPLLGSREITLIHDGCETDRPHKIEAVCEHEIVMDHLRVCWANVEGTYNCGGCEKCLRTMIILDAIGKLGRCRTLPGRPDPKAVRRLLYTHDYEVGRVFAREDISFLEACGLQQSPMVASLRTALARPRWLAGLIRAVRKRAQKLARLVSSVSPFGLE